MNIENLKNMPVVGQPADPIMIQVVNAIATFQSDLSSTEVSAIENKGSSFVSEINGLETARAAHWSSVKDVAEANEVSRRSGQIDSLEQHGADEVARLLGTSGVASNLTVFGLIENLSVENADWNSVLTANFNTVNDAQNAYFADMGQTEDISALDFYGS